MRTLPPAFMASARYDTLLQAALRQFFERAALETEAVPSASSDGRLAIEPTEDPAALVVRWFGFRHILRVAERRPFTRHEIRLARAVGAVLAARYRAIFEPSLIADREDLLRGHIEDRYIGAFLQEASYRIEATEERADRIATAIEVLRVAALSRYENRPISSGVLLLDSERDPCRPDHPVPETAVAYLPGLTSAKRFFRLCDGEHTVYLVNREGLLVNIVDVERWASEVQGAATPTVPCALDYRAHARATLAGGHVCIVLSPSHEIKVFAEGRQVFTFRNAQWHLLDLEAKFEMWVAAVGNRPLAERIFQTALDLSNARQGALFVILQDLAAGLSRLIAPADRLEPGARATGDRGPLRQDLLGALTSRTITDIDSSVLAALARIDGATVTDPEGRLLAVGAIVLHPQDDDDRLGATTLEGARTTAAMIACRFGPVLKVSEDGAITFFHAERIWDL